MSLGINAVNSGAGTAQLVQRLASFWLGVGFVCREGLDCQSPISRIGKIFASSP
jgi:hypothetical protein